MPKSGERGAIESTLIGNIKTLHSINTVMDRKALHLVVKAAQKIISPHLLSISDISEVRFLHRAQRKDNSQPSYSLFTFLTSGKRYRNIH